MMFQWPLIAEFYCRSGDLNFLNACFTGKKMGAKAGSFSDDDIEAYKYVFRNFGELYPDLKFCGFSNSSRFAVACEVLKYC